MCSWVAHAEPFCMGDGVAALQVVYLWQHSAITHCTAAQEHDVSWTELATFKSPHRQQCAHYALLHASMRQLAQGSTLQHEQLPRTVRYIAGPQVPQHVNPLLRCLLLGLTCCACSGWRSPPLPIGAPPPKPGSIHPSNLCKP